MNSCCMGEDSGGACLQGCGDVSAACKRKRNLKQQELNKLAQQRYRYVQWSAIASIVFYAKSMCLSHKLVSTV